MLTGDMAPLKDDEVLSPYCLLLYTLVRLERPRVMVETGRCEGHSTYWTALAMKHNGCGVLHSLDIRERPGVRERLRELEEGGWLKCHIGDSHGERGKALSETLGAIDALYIDGLHTRDGVTGDCATWLPLAPRLVIFHDWLRYPGGGMQVAAAPYVTELMAQGGWERMSFRSIDMGVFKK